MKDAIKSAKKGNVGISVYYKLDTQWGLKGRMSLLLQVPTVINYNICQIGV